MFKYSLRDTYTTFAIKYFVISIYFYLQYKNIKYLYLCKYSNVFAYICHKIFWTARQTRSFTIFNYFQRQDANVFSNRISCLRVRSVSGGKTIESTLNDLNGLLACFSNETVGLSSACLLRMFHTDCLLIYLFT